MYDLYKQHLEMLHHSAKYRKLGRQRQGENEDYLDFSSNDYLGLSQHPRVIQKSIEALSKYGIGSTGSRLLSGNTALHEALERQIAQDKHTEASLIFNSGFQANVSVLSSLLNEKVLQVKPLVFFDKLNHASLYQAIFITKPELIRYRHHDMEELEALLEKYRHDSRPKFIVTETVFGMDGDVLPIEQVLLLAKRYGAFLYLDEAHATGLWGPHGYGLSTTVNLEEIPHVIMGTFSKAIGCSGGYIACSQVMRDFFLNKASGFVYSTSPPPAVVAGVLEAWNLVRTLGFERRKLETLSLFLRSKLQYFGFDTMKSTSHIVPVIVADEKESVRLKDLLFEEGIAVSAVRPPTVPPRSSRLRIAVNTAHKQEDIERLCERLGAVSK